MDSKRRGIALVITLIMLSIITFMAVTFLVLSQREFNSVNGATDQKTARNASDAALARVSTELLTHMLLHNNFQDVGLVVSTNYINEQGLYNGTPGNLSPTNVNYDYFTGPARNPVVLAQDRNINIASLLYNPRPPVFVETNVGTHAGEFRFYLDLNRNGRFDTNGSRPVISDDPARPYYNASNGLTQLPAFINQGPVLSNEFVGDPEWIGVLERPEELHSADNRFIARYAYMVVPMSQALDVNTMHNRAKRISLAGEGYLRNQGVGPWELNLAAFLADLNTNAWWNPAPAYFYNTNSGSVSLGAAFTNANDILNYRYGNNYFNLYPASSLLPGPGLAAKLGAYNIDLYSDGPLMLGTTNNANTVVDNPSLPWSGADNTNHFFSAQDLFSQLPPDFQTTLSFLGTSNDSYNAYTYYRMLAQLGTDSAPEDKKINVNFKNTDLRGNIISGMETNLIAWSAMDFFTNAAAAMFRQLDMHDFNGNLITITNIPIYEDPTRYNGTNINYYTPAVHRVLQLAANIFDATTNRFVSGGPTNYPSVFRPIFRSQDGIAYIAGYVEVMTVTPGGNPALDLQYLDPQVFAKGNNGLTFTLNLNGVPWVIGAKKGFPSFNEFAMENQVTISRKISFTNHSAVPPWVTNQLFDLALTNSFNMNGWNSYTNFYGRPLRLVVSNEMSITITNQTGISLLTATNLPFGNDITLPSWSAWTRKQADNSWVIPLAANVQYTNGTYGQFVFRPLNPTPWEITFVPRLWMTLQFKVKFVLIDTTAQRVIDYVNLFSVQPVVDITSNLQVNLSNPGQPWTFPDENDRNAQWDTNLFQGIQKGLMNQILVSIDGGQGSLWIDPNKQTRINNFLANLSGGTNNFQAPFTPSQTIYQRVTLEANDPLVHYTLPDLTSTNGSGLAFYNGVYLNPKNPGLANSNNLNFAYQPWNGSHWQLGGSDQNPNQFSVDNRVKDSLLEQSDNWDFPTNKLPNIGWLGRIHRGTPWQTIDLKPANIAVKDWVTWANDNAIIGNGNDARADAAYTHPTNDYGLFDLFTTAVNENASAGKLNVNQTNLAAWAAVFGGVNVISNGIGSLAGLVPLPWVMSPSITNRTPMAIIMDGINATRANTNPAVGPVFQNGVFQHAGDVLATPQLTIESPFIDTNVLGSNPFRKGLGSVFANSVNDEMMERIPQQVMSLLTLNQNPRFVIYSYGQTLHPADHSLVIGGTFNGLCTNYQITAESATRSVVRVEGTPDPQYVNGKVDTLGRSYPPHLVVEQYNVLGPD